MHYSMYLKVFTMNFLQFSEKIPHYCNCINIYHHAMFQKFGSIFLPSFPYVILKTELQGNLLHHLNSDSIAVGKKNLRMHVYINYVHRCSPATMYLLMCTGQGYVSKFWFSQSVLFLLLFVTKIVIRNK